MPTVSHVLMGTPLWVFVLFLVLVALGVRQMRERQVSLARLTVAPISMAAFSFHGAIADFGARPLLIAAWTTSAGLVMYAMLRSTARSTVLDPATGVIHVAGSRLPLVLMLALFALRYTIAVALVVKPQLRHEALAGSVLYGALTGLLAGSALRPAWQVLRAQADARKSLTSPS